MGTLPIRSRTLLIVSTILAGAVLAACSTSSVPKASAKAARSSAHTPSVAPKPTSVPAATSTPASSNLSSPSSSSSSSSSSTTTTACAVQTLSGSVTGTEGGAGVLETTIALRNTGSITCTLDGYPGLMLLGAGNAQLATDAVDGGPLAFESVSPSLVSLAKGATAYFNVGFSDVPSGGESSCPSATGLQIIPPGATEHLVVPMQLQPCNGGQLHESAIFGAGSSAMQTTVPSSAG